MENFLEIGILVVLIVIHSIFGVGLLLFGTPSLLILGYDFANTINILMPVSICISSLQFFKSKVKDKNFIKSYNIYCVPFLIICLIIALKLNYILDFKLLVALILVVSTILILNINRFLTFKKTFFKFKNFILIVIGSVHGLTNMGGSFLAIYSNLLSKNIKEVARYYICYGYLVMGIFQYLIVISISFEDLNFEKLYYLLIALVIYFPTQKIFRNIDDRKFSKYINIIALIYGFLIIVTSF